MCRAAVVLAVLVVFGVAFAARADAFVYWANGPKGTIGRANLDGTGVNQGFITGAGTPGGVAVDSGSVWWTNTGAPESIGRANLDGTSVLPEVIDGDATGDGVAVNVNLLYWTAFRSIGTGSTSLNFSDPFFIPADRPEGVAAETDFVYWTNPHDNTIGRASNLGTDVDQSFITGANEPWGVAVDGSHIYWTNAGANTIGRANLDGTDVDQSFITGALSPFGIAVDATHIYWSNLSGTIGRANLDGTSVDQRFITGATEPAGVAVNALVGGPPPSPTIAQLVTEVRQLGVPRGTERSLLAKLRASCGKLSAFIHEVKAQSGKKIGAAEASDLIAQTATIRQSLGCRAH